MSQIETVGRKKGFLMSVKIKKKQKLNAVVKLCLEIVKVVIRCSFACYGAVCIVASTCYYGWLDPFIPKTTISESGFMLLFKMTAFIYILYWIIVRIYQRFIMNKPISVTVTISIYETKIGNAIKYKSNNNCSSNEIF